MVVTPLSDSIFLHTDKHTDQPSSLPSMVMANHTTFVGQVVYSIAKLTSSAKDVTHTIGLAWSSSDTPDPNQRQYLMPTFMAVRPLWPSPPQHLISISTIAAPKADLTTTAHADLNCDRLSLPLCSDMAEDHLLVSPPPYPILFCCITVNLNPSTIHL